MSRSTRTDAQSNLSSMWWGTLSEIMNHTQTPLWTSKCFSLPVWRDASGCRKKHIEHNVSLMLLTRRSKHQHAKVELLGLPVQQHEHLHSCKLSKRWPTSHTGEQLEKVWENWKRLDSAVDSWGCSYWWWSGRCRILQDMSKILCPTLFFFIIV